MIYFTDAEYTEGEVHMYTHHQSRYEISAGVLVQNSRRVQQNGVAIGRAAGKGGIIVFLKYLNLFTIM